MISIIEFYKDFRESSPFSNPLFNFSGCMTSHLIKYPYPRQETVTHCHIFRYHLFGMTPFKNTYILENTTYALK